MELEVGQRFKPTDEFLVQVLVRLATGVSVDILYPHMVALDIYGPGKEPWKLFSGDHEIWELSVPSDPERKLREKYIITKVSKLRIGKTNVSRTAGAGTWLDKSSTKDVKIGDSVVGHQKTLTYEYCAGDGAAAGKSYYYLHEFQLSDQVLQLLGIPSFDYVVCRVLKDLSKACRIGKKRIFDHQLDCPPLPKRSLRNRSFEASSPLTAVPEVVEVDAGQIDHVDPGVLQEYDSSTVYVPEVLYDYEAGELDVGQIDHVEQFHDYLDFGDPVSLDSEFLESVISIMNS